MYWGYTIAKVIFLYITREIIFLIHTLVHINEFDGYTQIPKLIWWLYPDTQMLVCSDSGWGTGLDEAIEKEVKGRSHDGGSTCLAVYMQPN